MIGTSLPHKVQLSPNFGERKSGQGITTLILHYTGMSDAVKACDWLCNEDSEVSCHYLIDEQGGIVQMVDEAARAWHAGRASVVARASAGEALVGRRGNRRDLRAAVHPTHLAPPEPLLGVDRPAAKEAHGKSSAPTLREFFESRWVSRVASQLRTSTASTSVCPLPSSRRSCARWPPSCGLSAGRSHRHRQVSTRPAAQRWGWGHGGELPSLVMWPGLRPTPVL